MSHADRRMAVFIPTFCWSLVSKYFSKHILDQNDITQYLIAHPITEAVCPYVFDEFCSDIFFIRSIFGRLFGRRAARIHRVILTVVTFRARANMSQSGSQYTYSSQNTAARASKPELRRS